MKANHCNVQCSYDPRDGHLCYSCDDCGLLSNNYRGAFTKGKHKCIENVDEQKHNDFLPQKLTDDNVGLTKKHTNSGGRILEPPPIAFHVAEKWVRDGIAKKCSDNVFKCPDCARVFAFQKKVTEHIYSTRDDMHAASRKKILKSTRNELGIHVSKLVKFSVYKMNTKSSCYR